MFLVTGATGGLGRAIVRRLTQQQTSVRAFVRLTSHYSELENRGAQIYIGDLREPRDIQKACRDVDYIISSHGAREVQDGGAQAVDYRANIDLIDCAKEAGVKHFVFISVLGADRGYEDAPVFKAKRAVEQYLEASGLSYTILRPSGLASNLLPLAERFRQTGVYVLVGDAKARSSIVSTDDLAHLAVDAPTTEAAHNQVFAVGGPEVLERQDIPRLLGQIFNRDPIVVTVPLLAVDGVRTVVGLFNPAIAQAVDTFRTLLSNEFYCSHAEIERLESTFNLKLETLDSFIRRSMGLDATPPRSL